MKLTMISSQRVTVWLALVWLLSASTPLFADTVFGLTTGNALLRFDTSTPGTILGPVPVTGLQGGENLVGIDFRPATGQLYGVGSSSRLYVINTLTGAATQVGSGTFTPALSGTEFGIDFNPTVDRLRLVSDFGQNLRLNPDTGAVVPGPDDPLAYAAGDPNNSPPRVVAVAYTNNAAGATSTTLYGIDSNLDILVRQGSPGGSPVSPNSGMLFTIGALGPDTRNPVGLDIASGTGTAFAVLTTGAVSGFYTINLNTGAATLVGSIGTGATAILDIAVQLPPPCPPRFIFGLTTGNALVRFDSSAPGIILGSVPVTGLQGGEILLGIDFRPATGQLYGLGSTSRLYAIDTLTGVATQAGAGAFSPALSGADFGIDFNPTVNVDRLRVVGDADQNLRLNPNTGIVAGTDTNLAYAAGDANAGQNPNVVAAAYTNNVAGATSTTLYGIDSNLDILVSQGSPGGSPFNPNSGTLFTIGALGVDTSSLAGLDIAPGTGTAFAVLTVGGNPGFYTINLNTGAATLVGTIGTGAIPIRDIAIEPCSSLACGPHTIHGHISTTPPSHIGNVSHQHHGQHGHTFDPGCPPHAPGHTPGLTTDQGAGVLTFLPVGLNADGTARPVERGGVVPLFGSADGLYLGDDGASASGFTPPASGEALYYTTSLPRARIAGLAADVLFSGLAPGLTGVWQINLRVPAEAPAGTLPVTLWYEETEFAAAELVVK